MGQANNQPFIVVSGFSIIAMSGKRLFVEGVRGGVAVKRPARLCVIRQNRFLPNGLDKFPITS